jgi:hypothetical protein
MDWIQKSSVGTASFKDIAIHDQTLWITGFMYSSSVSIGTHTISNATGTTGLVLATDLDGNTQHLLSSPHAFCYSINTDTAGSVYVSGYCKSPAFFEPYVIPFNGGEEIFVAKLRTGPVGIHDAGSDHGAAMSRTENPDVWQLHVGGAMDEPLTLQLYDAGGRVVKQVSINAAYTEIQCSDLSSGMYMWTLSGADRNVANGKLIR